MLIATDVVEEGIDVQECNLVIMFDRVRTFRSYVQSKGRARMPGSRYMILNDEELSVDTQIEEFKHIDRQLDTVSGDAVRFHFSSRGKVRCQIVILFSRSPRINNCSPIFHP